jgi:acyl carrier protein
MSSGIESQITALIATTLHVDPATIGRNSSIAHDLGADSLDFVSLILAVEDEFHIDIHDEDATDLLTVEQVIEYVELALATQDATIRARSNGGKTVDLR